MKWLNSLFLPRFFFLGGGDRKLTLIKIYSYILWRDKRLLKSKTHSKLHFFRMTSELLAEMHGRRITKVGPSVLTWPMSPMLVEDDGYVGGKSAQYQGLEDLFYLAEAASWIGLGHFPLSQLIVGGFRALIFLMATYLLFTVYLPLNYVVDTRYIINIGFQCSRNFPGSPYRHHISKVWAIYIITYINLRFPFPI